MHKPIVYSTRMFLQATMERAKQAFALTINPDDKNLDRTQILSIAHQGVQGFLTCGGDDFGADTIYALPDTVTCLSTVSVGYDHIDIAACKKRGIRVGHTPGVLDNATADTAWLCVLGAGRKAQFCDQFLRNGHWTQFEPADTFIGVELTGKRLGILGMGRIGRKVAKRAYGWDMDIHYHNRTRLSADLEKGAVYHDTPQSLFEVCDFLSINCPLTADTQNIINKDTLPLFPKGAVIVNTARGPIINDDALIESLQSGHIFAAGLDVFNNEPHLDKRYLNLKNVFILPHIGSATIEARTAMGHIAIDNMIHALNNTTMPHEVL